MTAVLGETVSPETAALLLARDFRPDLDVAAARARLDALAADLGPLAPGLGAVGQAGALSAYLFERLGFQGDAESYHDPQNSDLDRVLSRRRGLPITLSVLLAAVGRRVGAQVALIGFPGHFLARVGPEGAGVHVDPFFGGRLLSRGDLAQLAARFLGGAEKLDPAVHLAPVGLRALITRMLLNLKNAHERRGDHARALLACDRLVDLTESAVFRRERGLHALALGAVEAALADLEAYLEAAPRAPDANRIRAALAKAREGIGPPS